PGKAEVANPAIVVDSFQAIADGTALEGDTADVGLDARVGINPLNRHRQSQVNDIASLPDTIDRYVTVACRGSHAFAINVKSVGRPTPAPARNAYMHGKAEASFRFHGDLHFSIPRIVRLLVDFHLAVLERNSCRVAHVQN